MQFQKDEISSFGSSPGLGYKALLGAKQHSMLVAGVWKNCINYDPLTV